MVVHTPLPTQHHGENEFAKLLQHICADVDKFHAWFNCNPQGIGEIDVILWFEGVGLFFVEVKSKPISTIDDYRLHTWDHWYRDNFYPQEKAPHITIWQKQNDIRNKLHPRLSGTFPFVTPVVCWPKISRSEWDGTWDEFSGITDDFSKGMLFKDDLHSGLQTLVARLRKIRSQPAYGKATAPGLSSYPKCLEEFNQYLVGGGQKRILESDLEKLKRIEGQEAKKATADMPVNITRRMVYRGYPGTGKTFCLLQVAMDHALAGQKTLYVCYNKTLASDVRRIMSLSRYNTVLSQNLEIRDIFQICSSYQAHYNISVSEDSSDYDEWAEAIVSSIKDSNDVSHYDTILIDEGQDIKTWAYEMVSLHATSTTSFCIADGIGQELYGSRSPWLENFVAATGNSNVKRLNRNFRNSKQMAQLAQLSFETQLRKDRIDSYVGKILSKPKKTSSPTEDLFSSIDHVLPIQSAQEIEYIDFNIEPYNPQDAYGKVISEYIRILNIYLSLPEVINDSYLDVLLLVPNSRSSHKSYVVEALSQMNISYVDYANEKNRRDEAVNEKVRLCTYHSARGLEGKYVVLFGLETLYTQVNMSLHNLVYIALSRANLGLTIAVDWRDVAKTPKGSINVIDFIETALYKVQDGAN